MSSLFGLRWAPAGRIVIQLFVEVLVLAAGLGSPGSSSPASSAAG
jgi:hypothetical protein